MSLLLTKNCFSDVILRFQSHIDSTASQLGDLIQIENDAANWSTLSLESHPVAGESISKDRIVVWMSEKIGSFPYQWQGKTLIKVDETVKSTSDELIEKARQSLHDSLKSRYNFLELRALSQVKNSALPLDGFTVEFHTIYPVPKRICAWLISGHERIAVWFSVVAHAKVPVARHDLKANTIVQKKDFIWLDKNIAGLTDAPAEALPERFWIKNSLVANRILFQKQIEIPPVIVRGQAIKVHIYQQNVALTMDAIAETEGYLGDEIVLKNPQTQKTFRARVCGVLQAEIR